MKKFALVLSVLLVSSFPIQESFAENNNEFCETSLIVGVDVYPNHTITHDALERINSQSTMLLNQPGEIRIKFLENEGVIAETGFDYHEQCASTGECSDLMVLVPRLRDVKGAEKIVFEWGGKILSEMVIPETPIFQCIVPTVSEQQILPTDKGNINVGLSTIPANPLPNYLTKLKIDFIDKETNQSLEKIEYKINILKDDQLVSSILAFTLVGFDEISYRFDDKGEYQVTIKIEGISFQPVSEEAGMFTISVANNSILLPKYQLANGVAPTEVICKEEMILVFKSTDSSPACVKPQTKIKLIERGWASN